MSAQVFARSRPYSTFPMGVFQCRRCGIEARTSTGRTHCLDCRRWVV